MLIPHSLANNYVSPMVLATVYAFVHLVVRVRTFPSILSNLSGFIDRVEHIIIVSRHLASFFVAGSGAVSADSWIGVCRANAVLPLPHGLAGGLPTDSGARMLAFESGACTTTRWFARIACCNLLQRGQLLDGQLDWCLQSKRRPSAAAEALSSNPASR